MGLSTFLSGALLRASAGGPSVSFGTPPYLALLTVSATAIDTGTSIHEPTYTGYVRTPVPYAGWTLDASRQILSSPAVSLPAYVSGPGATVLGWALCDALSGGNLGWSGVSIPFFIDGADPAPTWAAGTVLLNLASAP